MGPGWQGVFTLKLPNVWEFRAAEVAVRRVIGTPEGCSVREPYSDYLGM